jgi:outer membrane protein assembly factor BamE
MNRRLTLACPIAAAFLAGACAVPSWMPSVLRPYRPDVQQGNIITKDMVEQLRTGMTRDQVRFLLGTPMLTDIFHQDRWDYPYVLLRRRTDELQIRKLYVVFEDGRLARYVSDPMPTEPLADNLILGHKEVIVAPVAPPAPLPAPSPATPASAPAPAPAPAPAAPAPATPSPPAN